MESEPNVAVSTRAQRPIDSQTVNTMTAMFPKEFFLDADDILNRKNTRTPAE